MTAGPVLIDRQPGSARSIVDLGPFPDVGRNGYENETYASMNVRVVDKVNDGPINLSYTSTNRWVREVRVSASAGVEGERELVVIGIDDNLLDIVARSQLGESGVPRDPGGSAPIGVVKAFRRKYRAGTRHGVEPITFKTKVQCRTDREEPRLGTRHNV